MRLFGPDFDDPEEFGTPCGTRSFRIMECGSQCALETREPSFGFRLCSLTCPAGLDAGRCFAQASLPDEYADSVQDAA